jgi:hypothetical protein
MRQYAYWRTRMLKTLCSRFYVFHVGIHSSIKRKCLNKQNFEYQIVNNLEIKSMSAVLQELK